MLFTAEHEEPRRTLQKFIASEINPHVEAWEERGIFPAREVFGKFGKLGLLVFVKGECHGILGLGVIQPLFSSAL